jgi:hypothetical protein
MQNFIMSDTPSISLEVSQNVESVGVHVYCIIRHIKIQPSNIISLEDFFINLRHPEKKGWNLKASFSQCWETHPSPPSPPVQYAGETGSQEKGGGVYFCLQQKGNPFLPADCKIFSTPSPHRKVAEIPMPSYTKIAKKYKEKS